jgi:hypothetical protein
VQGHECRPCVLLGASRPSPGATVARLIEDFALFSHENVSIRVLSCCKLSWRNRIHPMLKSFLAGHLRCLHHIRGRLTLKILNVE